MIVISMLLMLQYIFPLSKVSQMATYWFVIDKFGIQRAQKSKARPVARDVVKSEV